MNDKTVQAKLKVLYKQMKKVHLLLHPWRKNMRNVNRFYTAFIAIFGYENWHLVLPQIRTAWESARLDFDKMYGLLHGWQDLTCFFVNSDEKSTMVKSMNELTQVLNEAVKQMKENTSALGKLSEISTILSELQKSAKAPTPCEKNAKIAIECKIEYGGEI